MLPLLAYSLSFLSPSQTSPVPGSGTDSNGASDRSLKGPSYTPYLMRYVSNLLPPITTSVVGAGTMVSPWLATTLS